jgi:hypothetical protein
VTAVAEHSTTNPETSERTYPYPPTGEPLDSVTTIISATDSKPWIPGWYGRSSMAWAVDNLSLIARTLRAEGRQAAIDLGKDAAEQQRSIKRDAGSHVHDVLEALILWAASPDGTGTSVALPVLPEHLEGALYDGEPIEDVIGFMVDGFLAFVSHYKPRFLATEMQVYNQPLGYAGTLDMIFALDGYALSPRGDEVIARPGAEFVPCTDTKTGRNPEGTWKEQLAAYRRARECLLPLRWLQPMPKTHAGMVLHLRPEYPDCYLLMLVAGDDDAAAWSRFQAAARIYRERQKVKDKPGRSVRALREDGTMPGPRLCDLASEGYGRALSPLSKALGGACELTDLASFTADDVLAVKGVGPKLIDVIRQMLADHGLYLRGEELLSVLQAVRDSPGPGVN